MQPKKTGMAKMEPLHKLQREVQEVHLWDEDLAQQLERAESRSPQLLLKNKGAGGFSSVTAPPKICSQIRRLEAVDTTAKPKPAL